MNVDCNKGFKQSSVTSSLSPNMMSMSYIKVSNINRSSQAPELFGIIKQR